MACEAAFESGVGEPKESAADKPLRCRLQWHSVFKRCALRFGTPGLRSLAYELTLAETRERERIANGLHDDLGQALALAKFKLGELALAADSGTSTAIQQLRTLINQAAESARHATFELRSPVLQQLGLQAAIESLARRMDRLCGMRVEIRGELPDPPLSDTAQAVVFRVVRELLHNVHKHARAQCTVVEMSCARGHLHIEVADDGVGFQRPARAWRFSAQGGYGLFSAEAQLGALGGSLSVDSRPGHGTRASLAVPLGHRFWKVGGPSGWRRWLGPVLQGGGAR